MPEEVVPQLGGRSFSCPCCGALAAQAWFNVGGRAFEHGKGPEVWRWEELQVTGNGRGPNDRKRFWEAGERLKRHAITNIFDQHRNDDYEFLNLSISRCFACEGLALWIKDTLLWPLKTTEVQPHADMPQDVKEDFLEAAAVVERSPRGAAALARLSIQKLMVDLGESGNNINDDIKALVKKGLEPEIQQALDIVRVIGNNAVHPGQVDLKDDKATAMALLQLVNLVVERRIAAPKRIAEMFATLPPGALEAIKKRDRGPDTGGT